MSYGSRKELLAGIQAELPLAIGVIPFGMIFGVLALEAGLPPILAQAMSSVIFAGSAQFIAAELIGVGTPAFVLLFTIFVVNLRHMLYSASLAPYLQRLPLRWKMVLSYLLTDEAYAVTITHFGENPENPNRHWYFLGAGVTLWGSWQISTAAGVLLGVVIPASWPLDFTLALMFIALVIPTLKDKPSLGAASAAGITALAAYNMPYQLGLVAAALVGIFVGFALEKWQ